jgi:predicted nucleic acid-binding protein
LIALDTNILIYALDIREAIKRKSAVELVNAAADGSGCIGLQSVGEGYAALTRKLKVARADAAAAARSWLAVFPTFAPDREATKRALAYAEMGLFSYWDGLLLAAADAAGVTALVSEDMADGAKLGGVEIIAAFDAHGHASPRALSLLRAGQ